MSEGAAKENREPRKAPIGSYNILRVTYGRLIEAEGKEPSGAAVLKDRDRQAILRFGIKKDAEIGGDEPLFLTFIQDGLGDGTARLTTTIKLESDDTISVVDSQLNQAGTNQGLTLPAIEVGKIVQNVEDMYRKSKIAK